MRVITQLLGLVAVGAMIAGMAQAQTCLGYSSLANGGMNISGAAHVYDHQKSYGAQLDVGFLAMDHSHVIDVFAQENTYDDVAGVKLGNNTTFGGALAVQMKTGAGWEWCPQVGVDYTTTANRLGLAGVVGLGKALSPTGGGFAFVPYLWGGAGYTHLDCAGCGNDTHAVYGAGLGFRFSGGQQITPSVSMTSMPGDKAVWHATLTFPFGKM